MPDCYQCMWLASEDEPEQMIWKERAGPQSEAMDDRGGSGEEVERRLTAQEMAAADSDVLPLHTHAQAGAKGGRKLVTMSLALGAIQPPTSSAS